MSEDVFPQPGTPEWSVMNARRYELILKNNREPMTAEELAELDVLQTRTGEAVAKAFPSPITETAVESLKRLRDISSFTHPSPELLSHESWDNAIKRLGG